MRSMLIGWMLIGVDIAKDKGAIRFRTDQGDVVAVCESDCCSHTWIEHVELPPLPAKVTAVEDINMPGLPQPYDDVLIQAYGLRVTTDKGHLILDYRNESNGYYGGWLSWPGDNHYGGIYSQNSRQEWASVDA